MKKHIFILNTFILTIILIFSGCNDFLDKPTSKTTEIEVKTVEQLEALLGNVSTFNNLINKTAIYSTDDYELNTKLYNANPRNFDLVGVQYTMWDIEILSNLFEQFWSDEYGKIFVANLVLENLRKVSGDKTMKTELEAEAHLIRAYSYMELANTFCLPYTEANKEEMGLPLKQSVSFEELNSRNSLEETYALIEADLNAAATIKTSLKGERVRSWRGNTAAANAISARYWLNRNDYGKALTFADNALKEYNTLVDYNTEMRYSDRKTKVTINGSDPDKKEIVEILFPYTYYQFILSDMLDWKEFYYFRLLVNTSFWYVPSEDLLALYEENPYDLRYKYHIVEHYSYQKGMRDPAYDYPGYIFFGTGVPEGPTVAEMYLIKAECLARQNKVSEAMIALNALRKARIDKEHYTDETAANKEEAVKKIINERRREMPFSARWADIRRYNNNEDPNDDVGDLKRIFYPYTSAAVLSRETPKEYILSKNSRRWACPIPETEIISSDGGIKQNKY